MTLQTQPFQTCHQTSPYPYLQVHQTAVVDVVSLKGFPNALLPADARASQNLLEVNRSTSAKKKKGKQGRNHPHTPMITYAWTPHCKDSMPLLKISILVAWYDIESEKCEDAVSIIGILEPPKEHAWKFTCCLWIATQLWGFGSFFSLLLHEGLKLGRKNGCFFRFQESPALIQKASKIRKSDLVPKAIKTLNKMEGNW